MSRRAPVVLRPGEASLAQNGEVLSHTSVIQGAGQAIVLWRLHTALLYLRLEGAKPPSLRKPSRLLTAPSRCDPLIGSGGRSSDSAVAEGLAVRAAGKKGSAGTQGTETKLRLAPTGT